MADGTEENTPVPTEEDDSDSGSGSEDGSANDGQTEWLVTSRAKRSTAGNRLASLLQQEDPDDELELLFEEPENDEGFEEVEADSDVQMDSSDDDDDQGPAAGADDLDGEKELQRKERAEKLKKRKANDGIPKMFKKKVKIDPTALHAPGIQAPRPKKKSERSSWIPAPEDAPTRASQRGSTRQSKDELHKQMVDREIKRLKQLENMERAAARKEAAKKPAMTQEDRLAEAARVEKKNQKSLSRWEEAEQQREEEQLAKLAAMSDRYLEGPVITMWSGMAEWVGGTLKRVGKKLVLEDQKEKQSKKRKVAEMLAEAEASASSAVSIDGDSITVELPSQTSKTAAPSESTLTPKPPSTTATPTAGPLPNAPPNAPAQNTKPPVMAPPLMASPLMMPPPYNNYSPLPQHTHPSQPHYTPLPTPTAIKPTASSSTTKPSHPPFILAPPQGFHYLPHSLDGSSPVPGFGPRPPMNPFSYPNQSHPNPPPTLPTPPPSTVPKPVTPPVVEEPPLVEHATRNCIIMSNFDIAALKDKAVQMEILFERKFVKPTSEYQIPIHISRFH